MQQRYPECPIVFTTRYVGTIPPLNSIRKYNKQRQWPSVPPDLNLDSGWAVIVVRTIATNVNTMSGKQPISTEDRKRQLNRKQI